MAAEPAMRPTGEPLADVLDRATGARRAEADEHVDRDVLRAMLERSMAETLVR